MFIKSSFALLFIFAAASAQSDYNNGRFEQQQQQDRGYEGSTGSQQQIQEGERAPANSVEGEAGPEPPALVPQTSFTCDGKPYDPGMYADMEVGCSVYHMCFNGRKESFLCGTGTMFNQEILSCDHPQNVDCSASPNFYTANEELGKPGAEPAPGAQQAPRPRPPPPAATRPIPQRPVVSGAPRPLPRPAPVQRPVQAPRPQPQTWNTDQSTDVEQGGDFQEQVQPALPALPAPAPPPAPVQAPRPSGKVSPPAPRPVPSFRPPAPAVPRPVQSPRPIPRPAPVYRPPSPAQVPSYRPVQQPAPAPAYRPIQAPAPIPSYQPAPAPAPVRRPSKTSPRRPAPAPVQAPVVQTTDEDPDYEPSSVYYSQELPKQQQRARYAVSSRRWNQYRS